MLLHHSVHCRDFIASATVGKYQHLRKDTDSENRSNRRETCRSATVSATGPTWIGLRLKECLRSDGLFIDSLCYNDDIRHFIYRLTDKFFLRCTSHSNPLIRAIGNYNLTDLHRQYKKYKHKRTKTSSPLIYLLGFCSVFC